MKTTEDFKKLIEGFNSDISADNVLQVSVIRNGLVVHIYTNLMQQSIFKMPKWWLLFMKEYVRILML